MTTYIFKSHKGNGFLASSSALPYGGFPLEYSDFLCLLSYDINADEPAVWQRFRHRPSFIDYLKQSEAFPLTRRDLAGILRGKSAEFEQHPKKPQMKQYLAETRQALELIGP